MPLRDHDLVSMRNNLKEILRGLTLDYVTSEMVPA